MGEKPQNIKHRHISLGVLAHVGCREKTNNYRKACFLKVRKDPENRKSDHKVRIWIP